ncbi:MAG: hypothetical protein ACTHPD_01710 [Rhizomicrobium sp.]
MFGFAQVQEKRKLKAEVLRAQRAFDAARTQPLQIQQDIARRVLRECTVTITRLAAVSPKREREALFLLRLAELDQKIRFAELEADSQDFDPATIAVVLTQTLLATSAGSQKGEGLESVGEKIAQWSRNILPEFSQYEAQLIH